MRIGIITDSTCDLSKEYLDSHNVHILPISIFYNNHTFIDTRDPQTTHAFTNQMAKEEINCESAPYSKQQITDLFLEKLVLDFDYVICVTVSSSRSMIFENARDASFAILSQYRNIRQNAGVPGPFQIRVLDSQQLFTGQAAVVAEAINALSKGYNPMKIMEATTLAANSTQAFLVPANLDRLRFQARKKGDNSVGLMSYMLGSALDIKPIIKSYRGDTQPVGKVRGFEAGVERVFDMAREHITRGLLCPNLCISYGGPRELITKMPGFKNLTSVAKTRGVNILISEMSATAVVNIGAGALGIGFVSNHDISI